MRWPMAGGIVIKSMFHDGALLCDANHRKWQQEILGSVSSSFRRVAAARLIGVGRKEHRGPPPCPPIYSTVTLGNWNPGR